MSASGGFDWTRIEASWNESDPEDGKVLEVTGSEEQLLVVLTERLSNAQFAGLLQRLTARNWKQAVRKRFEARGVAPDGRRKLGQVNELVMRVLQLETTGLRVREIHMRIELILGEPVSRSSVKNSVHRLSRGPNPRLVRIARGRYRSRGEPDPFS